VSHERHSLSRHTLDSNMASPEDIAPVLAICGFSGAGKTTLMEQVLPALAGRGLKVAVVKHDVHGIQLDPPGKDSARLFQSGADVLLEGPGEVFFRSHEVPDLEASLAVLTLHYDLVLVEGHKDTALPRVWLQKAEETEPPPHGSGELLAVLPWDSDRRRHLLALLEQWLPQQWLAPPLYGCVLIGGGSRRMGQPKHLLAREGHTWLEHLLAVLGQQCREVVISGAGEVPPSLAAHVRVPDAPRLPGPLGGILSVMRWAPHACWLVCACDMPTFSTKAMQWLLTSRVPGVWASLPQLPESRGVEPLGAYYDRRARPLLEQMAARQDYRLCNLAAHGKIISPRVPETLQVAWNNINSREELLGR